MGVRIPPPLPEFGVREGRRKKRFASERKKHEMKNRAYLFRK
jgi:hypothetical protein